MSRLRGLPKTGGRKKGTPNRNTLGLQEALECHGLDVVSELINLLPQLDTNKRADILINLMSYIYPRRKAIEVSSLDSSIQPQVVITLPSNGREPSALTDQLSPS